MEHVSVDHRSGPLIATTVRIASWNVWWRFGARWRERQPGIVETLQRLDADVVALQEVWDDGRQSQAQALADALGCHHVFDAVARIDGVAFGNAILSRWPILSEQSRPLPGAPTAQEPAPRRVLAARIGGPRGALGVSCTHLSWRPEQSRLRQQQVGALCRFALETAPETFPPVVCGDFNAPPSADEIRAMTGEAAVPVEGLFFYDAWLAAGNTSAGCTWSNTNPNTHGALEPDRRIDYVFVGRPLDSGAGHVVRAGLFADAARDGLYPSDHFGVVAELRY